MEYQKYLNKHIIAEEHLINRIRLIFSNIQCYKTPFVLTEAHKNASSFGQKIISSTAKYYVNAFI